jgi:hypothetical protein
LFAWRDGRPEWRAALSDRLAARLSLMPGGEGAVDEGTAA